MDRLDAPRGSFTLARHPVRPGDRLRAWDAADEMLLAHLAEREAAGADVGGTVVLVNDGWGALATALAELRPTSVSDSFPARRAALANLAANGVDPDLVALRTPLDPLPERVDVAVLKVPKSLDRLEHQLRLLAPRLHAGSIVVAGAMARHVHTSTLDLFGRLVGPTRTTRAVKKARLILVERDPDLSSGPDPWPRTTTVEGVTVASHAGVFSARKLDVGTRFLLAHLPEPGEHTHAVDLGCGNGVVGAVLAHRDPEVQLTFVDESSLAVASAQATWRATFGPERPARFTAGDGLGDLADGPPLAPGSVDLVVVNPPFHQDHAVGDATAWQMCSEAREVLRPGGDLWVVGNRHLAHHAKLTKLFGGHQVVASDARFVVLRARR